MTTQPEMVWREYEVGGGMWVASSHPYEGKRTLVEPSIGMEAMRAELRRQVAAVGSVMVWCQRVGIENHSPVSLAMSGKRPVTEAVANACGYMAQTTFRKIGEPTNA